MRPESGKWGRVNQTTPAYASASHAPHLPRRLKSIDIVETQVDVDTS